MNAWTKRVTVPLVLLLAAVAAGKIKAVVLTGGHGFDKKRFPALFEGHADIEIKIVALKDHSEIFEDIAKWPYDVIVMYNMTQKISPKRQKNFLTLLDKGVGVVGLHHSAGAYSGWKEFRSIIGVKFVLRPEVIDGKKYPRSGYKHGVDIPVHVADPKHPITAGIKDFKVHDETYNKQWFAKDNHVLLTTTEPTSDKPLAWVRTVRKARVFFIQLGHGASIFSDKNYRRLVAQAIRWTTGLPAPKATPAPAPAASPAEAVAGVRTYKFGQSRKALQAAEKLIAASRGRPQARRAFRKALVELLASDATTDAKAWACGQLRLIGTAEDVPALAKLLTDKDLSLAARSALEGIPDPAAVAALRAALGKVKGRALVGLLSSLGALRDTKSIPAAAELAAGGDKDVAAAAVRVLGEIGGAEADKALDAVAGKLPAAVRPIVIDAKLKIAESLLAADDKARAGQIYRSLFQKGNPRHVMAAAMAGLVASGDAKVAARLMEMLTSDDAVLQRTAAGHVRTMPDKSAVAAFTAQLPKLPPSGQVALIRALAARSDAAELGDVARAVVAAAGGKDAAVRLEAIKAMAVLGDAAAVKMLLSLAAADNAADAVAARQSLRRLRGKDVDAALIAALPRGQTKARVELIRCLADRRVAAASDALIETSADRDAEVGFEALKALVVLADEKALPTLVKLVVGAKDAKRRDMAGKAVEAVCKRISEPDQAAAPVLAALGGAAPPVKAALLKVLGRIGGPKALAAVRVAVKDNDATVRDTATRALIAWPGAAVMGDLLALARDSDSQTYRVLALRGYLRLIRSEARPAGETVKLYRGAMGAAKRVEDKKLVLSGLAGMDDPAALGLVVEYFDDKALRAEAAVATMRIAAACGGTHPKPATAALTRLAAAVGDEKLKGRIRTLLEDIKTGPRIATNFAGEGTASSPDDLAGDGAAGGDKAAIDGNPVTYWDEVNGQKLYRLVVTFDQPRAVAGISILPFQPDQYAPTTFDVLCDGKVVKSVKGAKYPDGLLAVVFDETQCKAVELKITGYSGGSPAIRELGVYGRKAVAVNIAQINTPARKKVAQLPNGAWIVHEVPK